MSIFITKHRTRDMRYEKGAALLFTLIVMIVLTSVVGAYLGFVQSSTRSIGAQIADSQAIYLADASLDMAIWYLRNTAPDGSTDCSWRTTAYPASPGAGATDPQQRSLGEGTFTIWVQDSGSDIQVYARGTVGQLSRVITETLSLTSSALERGIHADGAHLKLANSSGTIDGNVSCFVSVQGVDEDIMTITGDIFQGDEQVKINGDFALDSYYALADAAGQVATNKTFANATYTGIWYITNKATVGSNARIEGSVISEKTISFNGKADNVFIDPTLYNPSQNYPALYAGTDITSTDTGNPAQRIGLQNSTINGLIFSGNNITFDYMSNTTFNGMILGTNNIEMENGSSISVNYNSDIFSPMPPGFTFSGGDYTVMPQGNWNEI